MIQKLSLHKRSSIKAFGLFDILLNKFEMLCAVYIEVLKIRYIISLNVAIITSNFCIVKQNQFGLQSELGSESESGNSLVLETLFMTCKCI